MNRISTVVIAVVAGGLAGTLSTVRPARANGLTLYGNLVKGAKADGSVQVSLRDSKTGLEVARFQADAQSSGDGFVAHADSVSVPDGVYALSATSAEGLPLAVDTFVNLQTASPGSPQVGHINIDGTLRAGRIGVGTAPTNARIQVEDASNTQGVRSRTGGTGVFGQSLATSGTAFGGHFVSASSSGRAVFGQSLSETGNTRGGLFQANSPEGIGLVGQNLAAGGIGVGVLGESSSSQGTGVRGNGFIGVKGEGESGVVGIGAFTGVFGSGTNGISGETNTVGGRAVIGTSQTNGSIGGQFSVTGEDSIGVFATNSTTQTTVSLCDNDGAIVARRGDIRKVYKPNTNPVMAVPLAYGVVNATGSKNAGTANFNSNYDPATKNYGIAIDNYDMVTSTIIVATPYDSSTFAKLMTVRGRARIGFVNLSGNLVQTKFSFIVYGDPLTASPPGP